MKKNNKILCPDCGELQEYVVNTRVKKQIVNSKEYQFPEIYATCSNCGEELFVPELVKRNRVSLMDVYRRHNDLISNNEINNIMLKYNIEKRPLSLALGMGEITITRYLDGYVPSMDNSQKLKAVLNDYTLMNKYLKANRNRLTDVAYKKCSKTILEYKKLLTCKSKIEEAADYIVHSDYEITNMSLQKLLYYTDGFSYALLGHPMFEENCEAWVHGPVYYSIYKKYSSYESAFIEIYEDKNRSHSYLNEEDKKVLNIVLESLGKYNGSFLRKITHLEEPWLEGRGSLADSEASRTPIYKDRMKNYFNKINKIYNIGSTEGVEKYVNTLSR